MRPRLGGRPGVASRGTGVRRAPSTLCRAAPGESLPSTAAADVAKAEEEALAAALASVGPAEPPIAATAAPAAPSPNPALAAKLAAAKAASAAYKKAKEEGGDTKAVGVAAAKPAPAPAPPAPPAVAPALFDRSTPPPPTASRGSAAAPTDGPAAPTRVWGADQGSESEPAAFLRGAFAGGDEDLQGLRMEEITATLTARERAKGADIITAAPAAPPADDSTYSPRVATWGVFPRPDNISKAYGGGRTIRPGDATEAPEAAAERKARQKAAMAAYRKAAGLEVDPADEKQAAAFVEKGDALLKAGDLQPAADAFAAAAALLPSRTLLGGRARLNQGIALDSMGKGEEAFTLYKSVERHPSADVARSAKRLLFGFAAAAELKADTISYRARKEEMDPYFGRLKGDYDLQYVPTAGENEGPRPADVAAALAVVGVPLLLAAGLVLGRGG